MSVIKQISIFNGVNSSWGEPYDIGANAGNIDLTNSTGTATRTIADSNNLYTGLTNILPAQRLSANKILISDSNRLIGTINNPTLQQLGFLSGTTANIQNQINTLNSNLNFIIKTYEYTIGNVSPGNTANVSASQFQVSTPDGYSVLGVQRVSYSDDKMTIRGFIPTSTGSQIMVYGKNDGTVSTASSLKANITIIYAKTELVN